MDPHNKTETKAVWYGRYLVGVDCVALAGVIYLVISLLPGGLHTGIEGVLVGVLSPLLYGIVAPLVHAFHGQFLKIFVSFGLRVALPLIFGWFFYEAPTANHGALDALPAVFAIGMGCVGAFVAMVLDWVFVARRRVILRNVVQRTHEGSQTTEAPNQP